MLNNLTQQADYLTNFAVITRYPNNPIELIEADMLTALSNAEQILSHVKTFW